MWPHASGLDSFVSPALGAMERPQNALKVFLGGLWVTLQRGQEVTAVVRHHFPQLPEPARAWVLPGSLSRNP